MGRVDAHYQCAIVERGEFDARGGSQARLAYTTFAGKHQDPHSPIVKVRATRHPLCKRIQDKEMEATDGVMSRAGRCTSDACISSTTV